MSDKYFDPASWEWVGKALCGIILVSAATGFLQPLKERRWRRTVLGKSYTCSLKESKGTFHVLDWHCNHSVLVEIQSSQICRILEVGRDLLRSYSPTPCSKKYIIEQIPQVYPDGFCVSSQVETGGPVWVTCSRIHLEPGVLACSCSSC